PEVLLQPPALAPERACLLGVLRRPPAGEQRSTAGLPGPDGSPRRDRGGGEPPGALTPGGPGRGRAARRARALSRAGGPGWRRRGGGGGKAYGVADNLPRSEQALDHAFGCFYRGSGDPLLLARLNDVAASLYAAQRHFDAAFDCLAEAYSLFRRAGDRHGAGR